MEDDQINVILVYTDSNDNHLYKVQYKNNFLGSLFVHEQENIFSYYYIDNEGFVYTYTTLNLVFDLMRSQAVNLLKREIPINIKNDVFLDSINKSV